MERKLELLNKKFGRWTVLSQSKSTTAGIFYLCQCDCGKQKEVLGSSVSSGKSKSCGCYHNDSKSKNLTGKKFNMLTCIKQVFITVKNKQKRAWLCQCDCGNTATFSSTDIIKGRNRSCGCLRLRDHSDVLNIKFGRLTPFEAFIKKRSGCNHTYYKCKCDCGNVIETQASKLKSGHTASCGCLAKELTSKRNCSVENRKYHPKMVSIKRVYKNYSDGDISLDEFIHLSQMPCHYCCSPPTKTFNYCKVQKNASRYKIENGDFTYNGLDRINSLKGHYKENVVPCCTDCNRFKSNMDVKDFKFKIISMKYPILINKINVFDYLSLQHNNKIVSNAKMAYQATYNDGISFEDFYNLSQLNCYYCNCSPSNKYSTKNNKEYFIYNGLDRVDSNLNHNLSNVVPCCKICNFGKSNKSINYFNDWLNKVKNNINNF